MSMSNEENPEFSRVSVVLRELEKETLLVAFKENDLTVD